MDEFRHRSFAQVCRAEANVSPSAPHRTEGGENRDLVRGIGGCSSRWKTFRERRWPEEESNARLTLKRANPPSTLPLPPLRTNPSVRSGSFRFSLVTLHKRDTLRALNQVSAIIMIHAIPTIRRNLTVIAIVHACIVRRSIASLLNRGR